MSNAKNPVDAIRLSVPEIDESEIDEAALVNILDTEYANQLITQAESNNDAHWIASHPDEYLEDGTIVRYKMLRLAAKEPEAIPFVRDWPTKYCADEPDYTEDHVDETSNGVPRLYQWDKRWGYTEYSSTTFALTGCAPTAMAMVYQARHEQEPLRYGRVRHAERICHPIRWNRWLAVHIRCCWIGAYRRNHRQ